jgi:hypothetical protein
MKSTNIYTLTDLRDNTIYHREGLTFTEILLYLRRQQINPKSFQRSIPSLAWYINIERAE